MGNESKQLQVTINATVPNSHLSGKTTVTVINSTKFVSLTDLSTISIPNLTGQNTSNLATLKKNIKNHVNNYLNTTIGKTITSDDWYVLGEDETLKTLLLTSNNDTKSGTIKIVATDTSTILSNSTNLYIENASSNPFDLGDISIPDLAINSNDKAVV